VEKSFRVQTRFVGLGKKIIFSNCTLRLSGVLISLKQRFARPLNGFPSNLTHDKANTIVSESTGALSTGSKANLNTYALCAGYSSVLFIARAR